ncbi:MAG: hypothetical protein KKH28_04610 [Elusimicrobia bacterium]|nr:hypothetical protein [Elusimicrobiota bacterium]
MLLPSLIILPSLLLFVYLIFETTKLSREKIRQQFAVDSAAFIQMGDYTNLLNRTAYVNGTFPYRIFKEHYGCDSTPCTAGDDNCLQKSDGKGAHCRYDMLYEAGDFPRYASDTGRMPVPLDDKGEWPIRFDETKRPNINENPPQVADVLTLITKEQGIKINISWGDAVRIFTFYSQVYTLLGQVEESQMSVFLNLTSNFSFFRKSYYLNANTKDCHDNYLTCGDEGLAGGFKPYKPLSGSSTIPTNCSGDMFMCYVKKIMIWAKVARTPTPFNPLPYFLGGTLQADGVTPKPVDMTAGGSPNGLFQLAGFNDNFLRRIGDPGYNVDQSWNVEENYFGIDFNNRAGMWSDDCTNQGKPCVHALVASQCPQLGAGNNCVWPNPTPKYQTRLYP